MKKIFDSFLDGFLITISTIIILLAFLSIFGFLAEVSDGPAKEVAETGEKLSIQAIFLILAIPSTILISLIIYFVAEARSNQKPGL